MRVNLERDEETGLIKIKQTGLIDRVIIYVGINYGMAKGKHTPDGSITLVMNADDVTAIGIFNYRCVVGMLLYLFGHTLTNIAFAVNCCARYMVFTKHSH